MLRIATLGELRQSTDEVGARSLRRKPLALVAYLARRAPRPVSRTELATLLWGERGEDRARQSLRQALLEVKQALGDGVDVDSDTVRLAVGAVELDLAAFERDVAAGRLAEAVARWGGDFFEGAEDIGAEGFRRWIENERAALHQQLGVAMERLIGDAELRGEWSAAAGWAERWAAAVPFDEAAHLRLVESLRMSGRSGEALQAHAAFVSRVRTVLDVEPSPEFLRLGGGLAGDARTELARRGRGSAAVHTPQLTGRGAVMGELQDAWESAVAGAASVCLLRGEGGSGRTRVCDEFAGRVGASGLVLRVRSGGDDLPLGTASALFDGLRRAPGLAGAAPESLAELARLVPALSARFQHLPVATGTESVLRDGVVAALASVAEEEPVLLVVDDVKAADPASARLLAALASRLPPRAMLLLAEDETDPRAGVPLDVRALRRVPLARLTAAEVEAMVDSMVTMEPGDRHALARRIHEESAGLPLAVQALVEALVDERLLALDAAGSWRLSPALASRPLPVPRLVRDRFRARLEHARPALRGALEALAVLGEASDAAVIAAVAEISPDEAEAALQELVARRVLRDDGASPPRHTYTVPLSARAVAANLPPTRRQALHARAAEVLATHHLATTAERSLLPYHLARAERPSGTQAIPVPSRGRRGWLMGGALAAVAAGSLLVRGRLASPGTALTGAGTPIVALGRITDYREHVTSDLTRPLTDMLATNLGRVPKLRVVSSARMYELVNQGDPAGRDTSAAGLVAAARRAGATDLVDGALYAKDNGGLRLDLRRVDLGTGNIRQTYSVAGPDVFGLADSGTAHLAADFGATTPAGSIADVTTRSESAYRLYEQGLRAYYAGDLRGAEPLFVAALAEDSSFAMAAYYAALSTQEGPHAVIARFAQAERLAARTSDRERLTIRARYAFLSSDPAITAIADTLIVRYPDEVEGYYFKGLGLVQGGDFFGALAPLNRVVAMDSLSLSGARASCNACEAFRQIVSAYQLADSLPAALRETRRWMRLSPRSPMPLQILADVLTQLGRPVEALEALDQQGAVDQGRREGERLLIRAIHLMYAGEFAQADRLLDGEVESGSPYRTINGLWYRALSYRQQGRLRESLADGRRRRLLVMPTYPKGLGARLRAAPGDAFPEAAALAEMGRLREAAALYDSVSRWAVGDEAPSERAHARAWAMTHATGARIAAGDTAGAARLADTIQALGAKTANGRDPRLHHYIRALLLQAQGRDEAAIPEFRQAVFSWNFGYTKVNAALSVSYLRLGRPLEAVAVLQSALRGAPEASNFYVTRTELHERLGQAWEAVGTPAGRDSAAAHYAYVARAWSRADSVFAARLDRAKGYRLRSSAVPR